MKRLLNYLRGTVRIKAVGAFPERLINLCAQRRVEFWAVDWLDGCTLELTVRTRGVRLLQELGGKIGCEITVLDRSGFPEFAGKFCRRYGFLIGLAGALCAVSLMSRFVLTIEITGNETVPDAVILQQLQYRGVRPGAYGPGLDRRQIEQEILLELGELSWMTINLHGTRVEVLVREAQKAPERIDEAGFYHVVADADGIVTHVEAESGAALVTVGDIVAKGDILISGVVTMEPPIYSDLPTRYYNTHARGRVWCRTWRTLTAVIPLEASVKCHTGRAKTVWSVNFFGKRTEIFGNSSISDGNYDKITSVRQVTLPGGQLLPVCLVREEFREYEIQIVEVDLEEAEKLLEQRLMTCLSELVGEDGRALRVEYQTRVMNGLIHVRAEGECLEEIGQEVPAHEQK